METLTILAALGGIFGFFKIFDQHKNCPKCNQRVAKDSEGKYVCPCGKIFH